MRVTSSTFGKRVPQEREGIREPFKKALVAGQIEGWQGCVVVEDVPVIDRKTAPDLVAFGLNGRLALIECKRATSGDAKKGMFEQVLMYGELFRPLLHDSRRTDLEAQCSRAPQWVSTPAAQELLRRSSAWDMELWIVVDMWSPRMERTARVTWRFLNEALRLMGRPPIRVWCIGDGRLTEVPKPEATDRA